ncbi:hypothetical protein MAPG_08633 [Magnaporthiopsis poae ATCC 64411]|uniref:Uncharacterized protein n=1 Tax=Magnaporthiopsis poae (strain ATCC 64411 / 73-15) TaxID=644358 RepID=A0A0C4E7V8_MAGP6|nr:hypothetical protein MAPG_08633 [Magnaporthiopsis poae ATCC 64411]
MTAVCRSSSSVYSFDTLYTATSTIEEEQEGPLVCEFRDLLGCAWSFGAHEQIVVITPALCHEGPNKRRLQFERRLRHVADHVVGYPRDGYGGYAAYTYTHMRPDFYVIRHLHHHGIINRATYEQCMQYTELPESLRRMRQAGADKPGASLRVGGGVRSKTDRGVVVFDQAREDRLRRKEEKKKTKK